MERSDKQKVGNIDVWAEATISAAPAKRGWSATWMGHCRVISEDKRTLVMDVGPKLAYGDTQEKATAAARERALKAALKVARWIDTGSSDPQVE